MAQWESCYGESLLWFVFWPCNSSDKYTGFNFNLGSQVPRDDVMVCKLL